MTKRRKKSPELAEKCEGYRHKFVAHPEDGAPSCTCQCGILLYTHKIEEAPDGIFAVAPEWLSERTEDVSERTEDVPE